LLRITQQARDALGEKDALLFDWHRVAICCAAAGEISLRRVPRALVEGGSAHRPLSESAPVYAHRMAFAHLAGRDVAVDVRRTLGVRRFTHDLPTDFGLRVSLGRLPATKEPA